MKRITLLALLLSTLFGCANAWRHEPTGFSNAPFEVAIVPGCPADADGAVSKCQWRRARWAAQLFHGGSVQHFVTSGAAVYNPYVEAEGLAAALVTLGVPHDRIIIEDRARHTDQNAAYSRTLIEARGWTRVAVISDGLHAVVMDRMLEEWSMEVVAIPNMDFSAGEPMPRVTVDAMPGWVAPVLVDERRSPAHSLPGYLWKAISSPWLNHAAPNPAA